MFNGLHNSSIPNSSTLPSFLGFLEQARTAPTCKVRIAPTPSGFLHLGNAFNFVLNALVAQMHPEGKILLRIDDLDNARKRPEYVEDIFQTLQWLGIEWQEGPDGPADFEQNWSQRLRLPLYFQTIEELKALELLYACNLSRANNTAHRTTHYAGGSRVAIDLHTPSVNWRVRAPEGLELSDFIVRQRNGDPSYQVASMTDDVHFKITHIVRGEDLKASTAAQQWLAATLGYRWFEKIQFYHHPLIKTPDGQKLSKSAGSTALRTLIQDRQSPDFIFQVIANWLGVENQYVKSLSDIAAAF